MPSWIKPGQYVNDLKNYSRKITYATASTLMKVYEAKCERQGWGEPDAIQKDIL